MAVLLLRVRCSGGVAPPPPPPALVTHAGAFRENEQRAVIVGRVPAVRRDGRSGELAVLALAAVKPQRLEPGEDVRLDHAHPAAVLLADDGVGVALIEHDKVDHRRVVGDEDARRPARPRRRPQAVDADHTRPRGDKG